MTIVDDIIDEEELAKLPMMSEDEFVEWAGDRRVEWVDGKVVLLAPDSYASALLNGWLLRLVAEFVETHDLGVVVGPSFTIRLATQRRRRVPDILFIPKDRMNLIRHAHFEGAPDLAIEIVGRESQSRDWREKYQEYEKAGVREYWIVDPLAERIEVYQLNPAGSYERLAETDGRLHSTVLNGFYIKPKSLWQQPLPRIKEVMAEITRTT